MAGDSGQAHDKNYNLITVLQQSLENVWALSTYIDDAGGDDELKVVLRGGQGQQRRGCTACKAASGRTAREGRRVGTRGALRRL